MIRKDAGEKRERTKRFGKKNIGKEERDMSQRAQLSQS